MHTPRRGGVAPRWATRPRAAAPRPRDAGGRRELLAAELFEGARGADEARLQVGIAFARLEGEERLLRGFADGGRHDRGEAAGDQIGAGLQQDQRDLVARGKARIELRMGKAHEVAAPMAAPLALPLDHPERGALPEGTLELG